MSRTQLRICTRGFGVSPLPEHQLWHECLVLDPQFSLWTSKTNNTFLWDCCKNENSYRDVGCDPGPFAAVLALMSPWATKYEETMKAENNHMHGQLEQIMDKTQKAQNLSCCFWRAGSKNGVGSKRTVMYMPSSLNTSKQPPKPLLQPDPWIRPYPNSM